METEFYLPDTFPKQESAIEAGIHAGRQKIDAGFEWGSAVVNEPALPKMDPQPENTLSIFAMIPSAHCTAAATTDRACRTCEFSHSCDRQRVEFTTAEL
jgi:hypothetical protein